MLVRRVTSRLLSAEQVVSRSMLCMRRPQCMQGGFPSILSFNAVFSNSTKKLAPGLVSLTPK